MRQPNILHTGRHPRLFLQRTTIKLNAGMSESFSVLSVQTYPNYRLFRMHVDNKNFVKVFNLAILIE